MPLIANRVTEKDIRDWIAEHGGAGCGLIFAEVELAAIKRPGWLQIFRFEVTVTGRPNLPLRQIGSDDWDADQAAPVTLFGVVRDDERASTDIRVYVDRAERDNQLHDWSQGLITLGREPMGKTQVTLMLVFAGAASLALVGAAVAAIAGR